MLFVCYLYYILYAWIVCFGISAYICIFTYSYIIYQIRLFLDVWLNDINYLWLIKLKSHTYLQQFLFSYCLIKNHQVRSRICTPGLCRFVDSWEWVLLKVEPQIWKKETSRFRWLTSPELHVFRVWQMQYATIIRIRITYHKGCFQSPEETLYILSIEEHAKVNVDIIEFMNLHLCLWSL